MSETPFFTSDTHFFHQSILWLGNGRPFDSPEEMNEAMIERWNATVGPNDTIYHLGDFSFGNQVKTATILPRLNGRKFFLWGNHDKAMKPSLHHFEAVYEYKEIKVQGQRLVLFHFPIESFHQVGRGAWHLHGHCHGNLADTPMARMDVGVDTHDFRPWSFEEIAEHMKGRDGMPSDHHQEKR